jgi:hypothetical protein
LRERGQRFIDETSRVLVSADTRELQPFLETGRMPPAFELAGPRAQLFFEPTLTNPNMTYFSKVGQAVRTQAEKFA